MPTPLQIFNIFSWLFCIIANIVTNTGNVGNGNNKEISDKYKTAFTPDGWAFSIWGVIFTWLGIFTIWQALPNQNRNVKVINGLGMWLGTAEILAGLWPFPFQYEVIWLSFVVMCLILLSLFATILSSRVPRWGSPPPLKTRVFWFVDAPVSVFFGWICAASVANLFILGVDQQASWPTSTDSTYAFAALIFLLGLAMLLAFGDFIFALTVTWSLTAVYSARTDELSSGFLALPVSLAVLAVAYTLGLWLTKPHWLTSNEVRVQGRNVETAVVNSSGVPLHS
jgi:hypothetical protein